MKRTIEIECPDGYKPIYNSETGNVEIVPENIMERIKTYEEAREYLGYAVRDAVCYNESLTALAKLQTIIEALNEGHKFNLLTGNIWYPVVQFFEIKSVPKNAEVIGQFSYRGKKFALVGGCVYTGIAPGFGSFCPDGELGYTNFSIGMFSCKSKEIAKYVSTQFGKLVFDACFARHFESTEFEWLD